MVSTRHHGYQDFLSVVEGLTDGSFIGWEKRSVVILNVTDDPGGSRTRRLLKENEAQVRQGGGRGERGEERGGSATSIIGGPLSHRWLPSFFLPSSSLPLSLHISLSPLSSIPLFFSFPLICQGIKSSTVQQKPRVRLICWLVVMWHCTKSYGVQSAKKVIHLTYSSHLFSLSSFKFGKNILFHAVREKHI